mgnify:CR=1 FL=1
MHLLYSVSIIAFLSIAEAVKVRIELRNPLQIPVAVSCISLICQLSTSLDASSAGTSFFSDLKFYLKNPISRKLC